MSNEKFIELLEDILADVKSMACVMSVIDATYRATIKGKIESALILLNEGKG